jgi:hypothetical protein
MARNPKKVGLLELSFNFKPRKREKGIPGRVITKRGEFGAGSCSLAEKPKDGFEPVIREL